MIEIYLDGGEWMKRRFEAGRERVESTHLTSRVPAVEVMQTLNAAATRDLVVVVGPSWHEASVS